MLRMGLRSVVDSMLSFPKLWLEVPGVKRFGYHWIVGNYLDIKGFKKKKNAEKNRTFMLQKSFV